jgi:HD-like signal output (HDOD) protein
MPEKTRIIFVDDEINVIRAMQRTLHAMRHEWDMEFLTGGVEALGSLARRDADIIVTDMRMPAMDGWKLLAEVKKRHPQTVRLLLSGHADPSSIMRSVGTAHQYLAKPCDSVMLKAAIAQTLALRQLLSSQSMAQLVGEVSLLPSVPKSFQELLACVQGPDASVAQAARIIGRDVAMTANVMKLVNSAFFGSRHTITSVERAVTCLGLDTLSTLVLGQGTFQTKLKITIDGFSMERLWAHSILSASLARMIAMSERLSPIKTEEAFLAGMLHDVGKIVFATRADMADKDSPAASLAERIAQMHAHHAEVGGYLLGLWGFPNSIVEAVAFHHSPVQQPGAELGIAAIVHIADQLAHSAAEDDPQQDLGNEPEPLERFASADRIAGWRTKIAALDAGQSVL